MSNPFPNRFTSKCNSCGTTLYEGDMVFAADSMFVCENCAEANDNVCGCGNFKKENFPKCYSCNKQEYNEEID